MAYNKTVWKTGDVITADKLNNLENGVETAATVVVRFALDLNTGIVTTDAALNDVISAIMSGACVLFYLEGGTGTIRQLYMQEFQEEDTSIMTSASMLLYSFPAINRAGVSVVQIQWGDSDISISQQSYPAIE